MPNDNESNQIVRVKILHDTTYQTIQKETNNYMKNILLLGGEIIGTPQLKMSKIPQKVIKAIHNDLINKTHNQQQFLNQLPKKVYKKCLSLYSQEHPDLHLDNNTTMKALKFYGLKLLINKIRATQQNVISQYKEAHPIINPHTKISNTQYYMEITYKMSTTIYKDSKKYL